MPRSIGTTDVSPSGVRVGTCRSAVDGGGFASMRPGPSAVIAMSRPISGAAPGIAARGAAARPRPPSSAAAPLRTRWIDTPWRKAEEAADPESPHEVGRGPYGITRVAVDLAIGAAISDRVLQEHGGWASDQMPTLIYRRNEEEAAHRGGRGAGRDPRRAAAGRSAADACGE